jgi:hypothetical protein
MKKTWAERNTGWSKSKSIAMHLRGNALLEV